MPGQQTRLHILVRTPPVAGRYVLELGVLHEHVRWFDGTSELEVLVDRAAKDGNAPIRRAG